MSALSIAAAGMNAAANRFERNASNITRAGAGMAPDVDLATEMVDMLQNQNQFEILATVARRAADMQKAGIDILA